MASHHSGPWSDHGPSRLTTLLFIVVSMAVVSACGSAAPNPSGAPATPTQTIHTLYFAGQDGSVEALQSGTGSLRWHRQLGKVWVQTASLLAVGGVLFVGRQTCPPDGVCQPASPPIGSIDALNVSDGTLLWHATIDVHQAQFQPVQVMAAIKGVVYVGVGGDSSISAGDVYALRAGDGSVLWHYTVSGRCCRGLVVTETTVFIGEFQPGGVEEHVDALRTDDGSLLWRHQLDRPNLLLGLVAAERVVYVGTASGPASVDPASGALLQRGAVEALRAGDGTLLWHSQTRIGPSMFAVADGIVYVGGGFFRPLDALRASDGSQMWQYTSDRPVSQASVRDGVVYLSCIGVGYRDTGSSVDTLRVSDGSHLWRHSIEPESVTNPQALQVVVGDGMVYIYNNGGTLHGIVALDATTGKQRWSHAVDHVLALAVGP